MNPMRILIWMLMFFSVSGVYGQKLKLSVNDLYQQTQKIYMLSEGGKALQVLTLCDSVIKKYSGFPGSELYFGYIYIYLAEAAKHIGDLSLARYSYDLSAAYFDSGSEMADFIIPSNLVALDLEACHFEDCLSNGLKLLGRGGQRPDPTKIGSLLINLAEAAAQIGNEKLADSLYCTLFQIISQKPSKPGFDSALFFRNYGRYKVQTGSTDIGLTCIRKSLSLYRKKYGENHYQVAKTLYEIGNAYKNMNLFDSAGIYYSKAECLFTSATSSPSYQGATHAPMEYEALYIELLINESDFLRDGALRQRAGQREDGLRLSLAKVQEAICRYKSMIQVFVGSRSGFILTNKARRLFDACTRINLDLYEETSKILWLEEALVFSLEAGCLSQEAKVTWEGRIYQNDSVLAQFFDLVRLREALDGPADRLTRSKQLQAYQKLNKQLSKLQREAEFISSQNGLKYLDVRKAVAGKELICFHQIDTVLYVFNLHKGRLSLSIIPLSPTLKESISRFCGVVKMSSKGNYTPEDFNEILVNGISLYRALLKPFVTISTSEKLLIRPDGIVMDLPFEVLIRDNQNEHSIVTELRDVEFLVKEFKIAYLSGIRSSSYGEPPVNERKHMVLLTCGDDDLAPDVNNESQIISREFGGLTSIDLNSISIEPERLFDNTDIIHFSGHVMVNYSDAFGSVLGCSNQSKGAFRLSKLLGMRLNTNLVFLNGCESAQGIINKGDGKLSPGLFFLMAGANGVIEHRWRAPDYSCFCLATGFYRFSPDVQPFEALTEAKRFYLATCPPGFDHPHYWAGMVYSGPLILKENHNYLFCAVLVAGISLVLFLLSMICRGREPFGHDLWAFKSRQISKD